MAVIADRPAAARDLRDTVRVGSLEVDRAPVTNRRYARFVAATGHRPPLYWPQGRCPRRLEDHPVVGVDFFDALAFAFWAGGTLPTEEEWLEAAGLDGATAYVWGTVFAAERCNTVRSNLKGTSPVGAFPEGTAPSGCVDLCGNVWEMTCTAFQDEVDSVIVKGGSWYDFPAHARLDTRFRARVHKAGNTVGLRLVYGRPLVLPHFLDPGLVAECIAYRHGDAPYFDDESEEGGEFDAIVSSLRVTAQAHVGRVALPVDEGPTPEAVEEALELLDAAGVAVEGDASAAPPPPPAASWHRRLRLALVALARATAWRRALPAFRALLRSGLGRSWSDRWRAAWAELRRPLRGPSLLVSVRTAARELRPPRPPSARTLGGRLRAAWAELRGPREIPSLTRRLRLAWLEVWRLRGVRPFRERRDAALAIIHAPGTPSLLERLDAASEALWGGDGPSLRDRFLALITERPRGLFLVLCVAVGLVVGLVGAAVKDVEEPNRTQLARVAPEEPLPPPAPRVFVRRAEEVAPAAAPLSKVDGALRDVLQGSPAQRAEAEEFLVWHGDEAADQVKAALAAARKPEARASLRYVLAAIEEGRQPPSPAAFLPEPPRRGLVYFCERLDATAQRQVTEVRRTARAHGLEITVVVGASAIPDLEEEVTGLGDVLLYVDEDGAYTRQLRVARFPAVAGLRPDGGLAFLIAGDVDRARLAPSVARLAP